MLCQFSYDSFYFISSHVALFFLSCSLSVWVPWHLPLWPSQCQSWVIWSNLLWCGWRWGHQWWRGHPLWQRAWSFPVYPHPRHGLSGDKHYLVWSQSQWCSCPAAVHRDASTNDPFGRHCHLLKPCNLQSLCLRGDLERLHPYPTACERPGWSLRLHWHQRTSAFWQSYHWPIYPHIWLEAILDVWSVWMKFLGWNVSCTRCSCRWPLPPQAVCQWAEGTTWHQDGWPLGPTWVPSTFQCGHHRSVQGSGRAFEDLQPQSGRVLTNAASCFYYLHHWACWSALFAFLAWSSFLLIPQSEFVPLPGPMMFNRALLMNIGYVEARKRQDYDCYIFHDVDMIPEILQNYYGCYDLPRHLMLVSNKTRYSLPYSDYFGGVVSLTGPHIEAINGFSNLMFGWGGEDDDQFNRSVISYMIECLLMSLISWCPLTSLLHAPFQIASTTLTASPLPLWNFIIHDYGSYGGSIQSSLSPHVRSAPKFFYLDGISFAFLPHFQNGNCSLSHPVYVQWWTEHATLQAPQSARIWNVHKAAGEIPWPFLHIWAHNLHSRISGSKSSWSSTNRLNARRPGAKVEQPSHYSECICEIYEIKPNAS